jgi:hypothetical protein
MADHEFEDYYADLLAGLGWTDIAVTEVRKLNASLVHGPRGGREWSSPPAA